MRELPSSTSLALDTTPTGVWKLRDWGEISPDDHARFVYHAGMRKVLLVSARPNRGVFAWDGANWDHIADPSSSLFMQGAAYDEMRDRVVVFGGLEADHTNARNSRATWVLEGTAWTEATSKGPLAGGGANLVYDVARDRVVLSGGADHTAGSPRNDTWLFDGNDWTKSDAAETPGSQYAGSAYDRARSLVVLVRPVGGAGSETWEWNGTAWAQVAETTPLPYDYSYSLAYDETAQRVVALVQGALWAWDGSGWTRADSSDGREDARKRAVIAYDASRGRLVAHNAANRTWEFDGSSWHDIPPSRPRARNKAASAYDPLRKRAIFFGSVTDPSDATWEWDGTRWKRGAPAPASVATGLAMAYDTKRARAVVIGDQSQTWEYDGAAWVEVGAAPGFTTLLAYDEARGLTVALLGTDTWTWDGTSWQQLMVDGPTSVRDSVLAYDSVRQRIVRFGGYTDGTGDSQIDETWEWDGSAWALMSPAVRPSARGGHSMAFDAKRGLMVLYGGYRHNEVWEYDGTTWAQRMAPMSPPGSFPNGLVYDAERARLVFYASDGTLWEFQPVGNACTSDDECPGGACVEGICCDRACTSSCEACTVDSGASQNGVCELLPDAGADCVSSEMDLGGSDGDAGPGRKGGGGDGGCSVSAPATRRLGKGMAGFGLALAALLASRRRRGAR